MDVRGLYYFKTMKNKVQKRYQSAELGTISEIKQLTVEQIRNSFYVLDSSLSELIIEEREMGRSQ
ncbi:hypothetical protein ACYCSU_17145 [Paenibacillus sp. ALE1]